MTLHDYIHEYDYFDNLIESCQSLEKTCIVAEFDYKNDMQIAKKKLMFENADYQTLTEAARDNFFDRIGRAIVKVIQAIGDFVQKITDRIFGKSQKKHDEDVMAELRKNFGKNPDIDSELIDGIKEGKYTLHDVAQFADDYDKLMKLIDKQKEDAPTLKNKVKKFCDKINDSAPLKITLTIGGILTAVTTIGTGILKITELIGKSKDVGYNLQNHAEQIRRDEVARINARNSIRDGRVTESVTDKIMDKQLDIAKRDLNKALSSGRVEKTANRLTDAITDPALMSQAIAMWNQTFVTLSNAVQMSAIERKTMLKLFERLNAKYQAALNPAPNQQ